MIPGLMELIMKQGAGAMAANAPTPGMVQGGSLMDMFAPVQEAYSPTGAPAMQPNSPLMPQEQGGNPAMNMYDSLMSNPMASLANSNSTIDQRAGGDGVVGGPTDDDKKRVRQMTEDEKAKKSADFMKANPQSSGAMPIRDASQGQGLGALMAMAQSNQNQPRQRAPAYTNPAIQSLMGRM